MPTLYRRHRECRDLSYLVSANACWIASQMASAPQPQLVQTWKEAISNMESFHRKRLSKSSVAFSRGLTSKALLMHILTFSLMSWTNWQWTGQSTRMLTTGWRRAIRSSLRGQRQIWQAKILTKWGLAINPLKEIVIVLLNLSRTPMPTVWTSWRRIPSMLSFAPPCSIRTRSLTEWTSALWVN